MYRFSATLLNQFNTFLNPSPYLELDLFDMFSIINRVPELDPDKLFSMEQGKAFHECITKAELKDNVFVCGVYQFSSKLIDDIRKYIDIAHCISEQYLELQLSDKYKIYGYADHICRDKIYEIKTTRKYEFPRYLDAIQHNVYMLASGIENTEYVITDFKEYYIETYKLNKDFHTNKVLNLCQELEHFIETYKSEIDFEKSKILNI